VGCSFATTQAGDNKSTIDIGKDIKDHAAQYCRDEEFIEEVDIIDNRENLRAGFIMTQP
jgi:hypothetical protein